MANRDGQGKYSYEAQVKQLLRGLSTIPAATAELQATSSRLRLSSGQEVSVVVCKHK